MLISHRGFSAKFPENTLLAFRKSNKFIEFDVRKTKDNIPIVIHDNTLDRTTNASGKVEDHTWDQIQKLTIRETTEKIPSLDQVLAEFGTDFTYDIEIKSRNTSQLVVDAILESGIPYDKILVTSFDWEEIKTIRKLDDNILTGLISLLQPKRAIRNCKELGCSHVVLHHHTISQQVVDYAIDLGIKVYAYTVNNIDDIHRLLGYGVAAIITDNPNISVENFDFVHL
jgi:glycerophosphoryl diester phosphodiesterase